MDEFLNLIRHLVEEGKFEVTAHAYVELNNDSLVATEIVASLAAAVVVEFYPDYHKGASILVLQKDGDDFPVHALWGIPKGKQEPAFLITAYRPSSSKWTTDFLTRKPK
jgi:Domain of unknown function (DUF4258)